MTEFFEFGSFETVENLSDLGSSRYEGTDEGLGKDLFESFGEWKDKPASEWFAPIPVEVGTPAKPAWETPTTSNDWWNFPEQTSPEVTNPWKPEEVTNPWQNWGTSTWEHPKTPEVKEQPAPRVPEWNDYRPPFEVPRPSQEQRPQGPTWGELAQQVPQWFQEQTRPREQKPTAEQLNALAAQRLEFEEKASQEFLQKAEKIEGLRPGAWHEANLDERIQTLLECGSAYQEAFGLGDMQLEIDPGLEEGEYGFCSDHGDVPLVCIGEWVVQTEHPKDAIETLLHEMRHAYQFQYVAEARAADNQGIVNFDVITTQNWLDAIGEYSQEVATYANSSIEQDADRHAKDLLTRLYVR